MSDRQPAWFARALEHPSTRGTVTVRQVEIAFEAWGEVGQPGLVLVHGSNAHLEWWRFVAPFLADQFRVVALDSSGNGDSGWRPRYDGEVFADEVMAVAGAAELGPRPFVVGHSFGGFVTLEAGFKYGRDLGGLIMVDFTVAPPQDYLEWGMRARRENKKPRKTRVYEDIDAAVARFRLLPDQPTAHPCVLDHIARCSVREVEGGWTWKFDPTLFDHLEMGADQDAKFVALECRSAVVLGEDSGDEGAFNAPYMRRITANKLPAFVVPGTHHHLMFEEPIGLAMAIKGIVWSWIREDGADEMAASLTASRREVE